MKTPFWDAVSFPKGPPLLLYSSEFCEGTTVHGTMPLPGLVQKGRRGPLCIVKKLITFGI